MDILHGGVYETNDNQCVVVVQNNDSNNSLDIDTVTILPISFRNDDDNKYTVSIMVEEVKGNVLWMYAKPINKDAFKRYLGNVSHDELSKIKDKLIQSIGLNCVTKPNQTNIS